MMFEAVRATADMADSLGLLHAMSWQKAYKGIVPEDIISDFTPEKRAEVFRQALATRPEEYYLFSVDKRPAGLALIYQSHEKNATSIDGEIYAIYFHPDFWGLGYAGEAMRFCLDRLKQMGYTNITIWVLEENNRARKFYEKFGFAPDGTQKEILIGKPLIQIRYQKHI